MKKEFGVVLCTAAVASSALLAGCSAPVQDVRTATPEQIATSEADPWDVPQSVARDRLEGSYKDGTYTGVGQGMDGVITVTLSIANNKLGCIAMTQEGETPSVGGYEAIRDGVYAEMINTAQGADIDTIAGATITTLGVRQAVEDALSQAQG